MQIEYAYIFQIMNEELLGNSWINYTYSIYENANNTRYFTDTLIKIKDNLLYNILKQDYLNT